MPRARAERSSRFDGKTVRGSFDRSRDQGPLHIVSAWASERGLVLGQRQVDTKSNEITAIPQLLDTLDLKKTIVTLDAMGCQRSIASKILERGADYLVTLKANQGKIFAAVRQHCAEACFTVGAANRPACDGLRTNMVVWFGAESSPVLRPLCWSLA